MKRICFITQCVLPIPTVKGGAVETLVEYLMDENENKKNFEFIVYSVSDKKAEVEVDKYKYTTVKYINHSKGIMNKLLYKMDRILQHFGIYIPFSVEFFHMLKKLKLEKNIDYFIYEAGPTTQIPLLARIIPKDKLLVHIHWNGMGNKNKDKCFSHLIAVSEYIGQYWKSGSKCEDDKVCVLPNCSKIERFHVNTTENENLKLRDELGIPKDHAVIIFAGRIVKEKGVKELLNAYEKLNHDKVSLIIVGSANFGAKTNTSYEKEVDDLIKKSTKRIIFTGFVHQSELYKYYNIADVAVMPSLFQDPAPLVSIETQATGTPLVATRVGGIPEYVGDGCGILVQNDSLLVDNLRKEIDYLLDNPQICEEMSTREILHSKKFTTEAYYDNFTKIINDIAGKKYEK